MNWRWISFTALLAAVVIGFGALSGRDAGTAATNVTSEQPSFYAKDAIVVQTQEDGSPQLRLVADRIEQKSADDSIVLHKVRVDYLQVPGKRWVLTADQGFVPADSRIVNFSGNVELQPSPSPAPTFLHTDALAIDTERNVAYTTSSPTRMQFGRYTMRVKRAEADLKTEKIKLESAHGRSERSS